jgi:CheY-like chemotaxis protein
VLGGILQFTVRNHWRTQNLRNCLKDVEAMFQDCPRSQQLRRRLTWRVLIVDDSPAITSTFSKLLNLLGHETQIADNGEEALSFAINQLPDVVFSDLEMPRLNGYEFARQIRTHSRSKSPLLVAVSGYGRLEDRTRALEAGFDHFLVKPAMLSDLEKIFDGLDQTWSTNPRVTIIAT